MNRIQFLLILPLVILTLEAFGQSAHAFKKWKSRTKFKSNEIVFLIDTSRTADETKVLSFVASKIDDNLKNHGIKCSPVPYPSDSIIASNIVCLKLEALDEAYVSMGVFNPKGYPLCFRLKLSQVQPISKRPIETTASISIPEMQKGVDDLGVELAKRLRVHFEQSKK